MLPPARPTAQLRHGRRFAGRLVGGRRLVAPVTPQLCEEFRGVWLTLSAYPLVAIVSLVGDVCRMELPEDAWQGPSVADLWLDEVGALASNGSHGRFFRLRRTADAQVVIDDGARADLDPPDFPGAPRVLALDSKKSWDEPWQLFSWLAEVAQDDVDGRPAAAQMMREAAPQYCAESPSLCSVEEVCEGGPVLCLGTLVVAIVFWGQKLRKNMVQMPAVIGNLTTLRYIDWKCEHPEAHCRVPSQIGRLSGLVMLGFYSRFYGELPSELGHLHRSWA